MRQINLPSLKHIVIEWKFKEHFFFFSVWILLLSSNVFYLHMCMFTCVYSHICVQCMFMYILRPEADVRGLPKLFLSQSLSLNLECTKNTRLAGQKALGIYCLCLPRTGKTGTHLAFYMGDGDMNSVLMLSWKVIYCHLSHKENISDTKGLA